MGHCFSCLDSSSAPLSPDPERPQSQRRDQKHGMREAESQPQPVRASLASLSARQPLLTTFDAHSNGGRKGGYPPDEEIDRTDNRSRRQPPRLDPRDSRSSDAKIEALFRRYRDDSEDAVLTEGIERLCADLRLDPEEFRVLVFAWKSDAQQMCCFTKEEFFRGFKSLRADSLESLADRLPDAVIELRADPELFKDLYRFTFKFGLDAAAGQRILPADVAVALWRLVFSVREPPVLRRWLAYLERHSQAKGIPKDTWYMFLNFCDAVGEDLGGYDDTEAWPSLFDDFVEFENDRTNQNVSRDEAD